MSTEIFEANSKAFDLKLTSSFNNSKRLKKTTLAFLALFKNQEVYQINLKLNWAIFTITEALCLFQFSSLMWRTNSAYNNWTSFLEFWKLLSYSRVDTIFSDFGSSMVAYYVSSAYIYIAIFMSMYLIYNSFNKAKPIALFVWILKKQLCLGSSVLFFPFFILFLSFFLDYFGLYQGKSAGSLEVFYSLQWINCLVCLAFHVFFSVVTIMLDCEVAHGECEKYVKSKSSCNIDIKSFIIDSLLLTIYCLLPDGRIQLLHCCAIICKLWKFAYICYFIPYYNKLANKISLARVLSELVLSSLFACNYFINQGSFLFFSSLLIVPLCIIFALFIVEYRYSVIQNNSQSLSLDLFEISIRDKLISKEHSIQPIEKFNNMIKKESFIVGNVDYVYIWLAYYCIYTLKDYKLAYIKLAAVNKKQKSTENFIQVLKIRYLLKKDYLSQFEDLCFLDYILKLNRNKNLDKEICESYLEFATEITGKTPSKAKLKAISHIIDQKLVRTTQAYKKICDKYPKGIEARRLFKSFFEEIYTTGEKGLISKLLSIEKYESTEINYFDQNNGILIVSGESTDLGRIIYSNDRFSSMLKTSSLTLMGSDLNSIIPYPYNIGHNGTLIRYAKFCTNSLLRFPGSLFLKTENNFLVEFHFKISCVSLTNSIFYLVVAKEIISNQIIVLLSPTGLIYSHSEGFSRIIDKPGPYFENNSIQYLLPQVNINDLGINTAKTFVINFAEWHFIKSKRRIANVEILVLFIVDSQSALDEIIKQNRKESRIEKNNIEKKTVKANKEDTYKVRFNEETSKDTIIDEVTGANIEKTEQANNNLEEKKNNEDLSRKYKNRGLSELGNILNTCLRKLKQVKILIILFLLCIGSTCVANIIYTSELMGFLEENQLTLLYLNYMDDLLKSSKAVSYIDSGICVNENIQNLNDILENIDGLNLRILNHVGKFSSCTELPLSFEKKSLYFYEDYETMYKNQLTLFDAMEKYEKYIGAYLSTVSRGESNATESGILVNNGLIYLYEQAIKDYDRIDGCYDSIVKDYGNIQYTIFIVQILLLSVFFMIYCWQIAVFIKGTNQVWKKISENAYKSFYTIKSKCCERMVNMLQAKDEEVQVYYDYIRQKKNEFSITYSQIGGYCWRFSIFFILAGLYLLVFYLFLFGKLISISVNKTDLINSVYFQKLNLEKLENYALIRINNFDIAQEKIDKMYEDFYNQEKKIELNNFKEIMNGKLFEYFLDYKDGQGYLIYGLKSVDNLMIIDNFGLINADSNTWTDYYIKVTKTYELFDLVINEIERTANSKLDEVYVAAIAGLIVYFVLSWLLALVFYFPYLQKKGVTIKSFQSIFQLFISLDVQELGNIS